MCDTERGFIVGAPMAGGKTVQVAVVSIRTVSEVTSAFNEKDISKQVQKCGQQYIFGEGALV